MKNFSVVLTYSGYDWDTDNAILSQLERRDRRLFGGSGFSFLDGGRDLCFDTSKKEIAQRLKKNLLKAANKHYIRAFVEIIDNSEG